MIKVVTIEREYGTGAAAIAKELAEKTGFTVWDQGITEQVARRLRCDVRAVEQREERPDSTYYRLVKTFMRGSYEDRTGTAGFEMLDAEGLSKLFESVVTDIANKGQCILVGRAAPWFLKDRIDTCHVFLYASHEEKLRRVISFGKTQREAESLLETVDRDRIAFVKKYYNKNWPTRELYHLMANTSMGYSNVVSLIQAQINILNRVAEPVPAAGAAQLVLK